MITYKPTYNISISDQNLEYEIPRFQGYKKQFSPQPVEGPKEETVVEETPVIQRGTITYNSGVNVGNMQHILDKLADAGISVRATSGARKAGTAGKAGNKSHHVPGNAIDIVPDNGETWDSMKQKIKSNPELLAYFRNNGLGIIDETNPETMRRTGATGAHWHIGPDKLALKGFETLFAKSGGVLFAKSGIHIKEENRGKFTALKRRTGKSTEELTHSKNPLTRKRAIFAQNAKKWNHKVKKHQNGGKGEAFLDLLYQPVKDALLERGLSLNGLQNILRQAAYESGYGEKRAGTNNFSGIKNGDGTWRNFNSIEDWAKYQVKLLDEKYHAAEESDVNKFVDLLHQKSTGTGNYNYSGEYNTYKANLPYMKTLDNAWAARYTKPETYEEFLATVPEDFRDERYNLEGAFDNLPYQDLVDWRINPKKYHLSSGYEDSDGNYQMLKRWDHPSIFAEFAEPGMIQYIATRNPVGENGFLRLVRKPNNYVEK